MLNYISVKLIQHWRQIARYTIIGVLCFALNYVIAVYLEKYIFSFISATIGYIVGVLSNYILSIKWVFKKRELAQEWKKELGYFLLIELCAMVFMLISLFIFTHSLRIEYEIAIIPANFVAAVWNYFAKYIFLFRKHGKDNKR